MTDDTEKVFVQVAYLESDINTDELTEKLASLLSGLPCEVTINKNTPPRIFNDEELENRFYNLWAAAKIFRERFIKKFGIEIELDPRLLYLAIVSAFDDIERYKAYHLEKPYKELSDAVKRSAYLTKWISKIAPFQTRFASDLQKFDEIIDPKNLDAKPALANILFSIMVSMIHITIQCQKNTFLSPETEFQLSYDLLFRRINEDALLSTYQKITDLAGGESVIKQA